MVEAITQGINNVATSYGFFLGSLPSWVQNFLTLFIFVVAVVIYSVFVWKIYRFIAKKNLLELDLKKYNRSEHPIFAKFFGSLLYLLEYIILSPILIFFWFIIFTAFLIVLTETTSVLTVLLISAVVVAAIRMTSYYKEDLSRDLAKMIPFTLLAVSLLNPGFFSLERVGKLVIQIPDHFGIIFVYLSFIVVLEIILRFFEFLFSLMRFNKKV